MTEQEYFKDLNYNLLIPTNLLTDDLVYLFKSDSYISNCTFHKVFSEFGIILQDEYNIYEYGIKNYEQDLIELLYKLQNINEKLNTISYLSQLHKVYFEFMYEDIGCLLLKFKVRIKL